ncbi:MAG: hypothetical protein LAP87_00965 [Acidobacteriia bacterium]|nr:hypothetical protein [Terriglobia bacterium]
MNRSILSLAIVLFAGPAVAAADDLEDALQNLKAAEAKKDVAQVKKLAVAIHEMTCETIATPAPQNADEKEAWTNRVDYAKSVQQFAENTLWITAAQAPPATLVDLVSTLEQLNPKSKFLMNAYGPYIHALNQTGAASKVPAIAERALANFPDNTDLLLVMADTALNRKQNDRAAGYATRLVAAFNQRSRPEGVSDAEWQRVRSTALGRGYWIAGVIHGETGKHAAADKELRAALPLIKGNDAMTGAALFYLGMANYQLGKMTLNKARVLEGAKFSEEAGKIEGPFAERAWRNAMAMKTEAGTMR